MTGRVAILIQYFGPWPEWINFFVESCRSNAEIDWIIFGDADPPENRARNVRHIQLSFADYKALLESRLELTLASDDPYKLCDFKPALAFVHRELVEAYDFTGFGDLDVIYGDIRAFYDDKKLARYDLLSAHRDRVSGHLCLMRNSPEMRSAFQQVPRWRDALSSPEHRGFDERAFFNLFRQGSRKLFRRAAGPPASCFFEEAYSTPAATRHMRWYWADGRLTNEFYPHHPFMYLHFMSWHSNRWHGSDGHVAPGAPAPWQELPSIVQMDWRDARRHGFMISPDGIQPIERRRYP